LPTDLTGPDGRSDAQPYRQRSLRLRR